MTNQLSDFRFVINPVKKVCRIAYTLLFTVAACTVSSALDSPRKIGQFTHTAWGEKEGAPQHTLAIEQTKDGYLWLASHQGLFRFDGVTFEHFTPQAGPALPDFTPTSLLALPDGDLWIGFKPGVISRLKNGRVENFTSQDGVPGGIIRCLVQDREGTIWAGARTGLARLEGNRWKQIGKEWNFTGKSVRALLVDRKGTLWVATDDTIVFLPQGSRIFQSTSIRVAEVEQLVEAPNGKLWMVEGTRVRPIPLGVKLPPSDKVEIRVDPNEILFTREGDLWIGTDTEGIRRAPVPEQLRGKSGRSSSAFESFTTKNGLTDNNVITFFQDHDGNIWASTASGLDRFRMGDLVRVTLPVWHANPILVPGNSRSMWAVLKGRLFDIGRSSVDEVKNRGDLAALTTYHTSVYRDPKGVVWWLSNEPALVRFENGRASRFPPPRELPKPFTENVRITEDGSGVLWMAAEQRGLFRRQKGQWSRFDTPSELSKQTPAAAFTDGLGRAWFGYNDGTIIYLDNGKLQTVSTSRNSPVKIVGVIRGRNQHIWVGGYSGLVLFDGDKFHEVLPADRSSFNRVSEVKEFADGSLWLCEPQRLIHIEASEVRRFLQTPSYRVRYQVFDSLDGLPGSFRNCWPKLVEGTDGRIWFAADHGIAWMNPATFSASVSPPVSIRSITAAGKQFEVQPGLTLTPRTQDLRIEFTAVNLSFPERLRYRYKLDGVDTDWQDVGFRREAFYTNLGPGRYKFHVTTRNEGRDWTPEEAVLDFRIAPAWFQTMWFRAFCVCIFFFLLWTLYQIRLRQLERQFNMTLEARVSERTRIARELHDTLLQSFNGLLLRFQSVSNLLPARPQDAKQRVDAAIEKAAAAIAEGRDAVQELRSGELLATSDLAQAIGNLSKELLDDSSGEDPVDFHVHVEGKERDLNPLVRDEAYRIAAEALRNAIRHADARRIEGEVRYDEQQLRVRIRDDGKGIDPNILNRGFPGRWGLRGMRERARLAGGNLEVWSEPGSGTEVELTIPAANAYTQSSSHRSVFRCSDFHMEASQLGNSPR